MAIKLLKIPSSGKIVIWRDCPDCNGRGTFLKDPFATGGSNGCGGIHNLRQCGRCVRTSAYYDKHGRLPDG